MPDRFPRHGLRTLFILVSLACGAPVSVASPLAWIPNGSPVCTADSAQLAAAVIADPLGPIVSWLDLRSGAPQVFGLRLDKLNGGPYSGWLAGGRPLGSGECELVMASDGSAGAYIVSDTRTLYANPEFSHLRTVGCQTAGAALGGAAFGPAFDPDLGTVPEKPGRRTPPTISRHHPALASDGVGSVFFASFGIVSGQTQSHAVLLERIPLCGSTASRWSATLATDTIPFAGAPAICSDGSGGAFVAWTGMANDKGIRAVRIAAGGTLAPGWPAGGQLIRGAPTSRQAPGIAPDGSGGAFIAWQDRRGDAFEQTCVQHLDATGAIATGWSENGLLLCSSATSSASVCEGYGGLVPSSCVTTDGPNGLTDPSGHGTRGGAIVVWTDHRAGSGSSQVYAQRVLDDGSIAAGWPADGLAVSDAQGEQRFAVAASDGSGGAYIAWQEARSHSGWDIGAQHVNRAGGISEGWDENGLLVCAMSGDQTRPAIGADGAGGAYVVWSDTRAGNPDIYAMFLRPDLATPVLVSLVEADAEPGRVRLVWFLADPPPSLLVQRRIVDGRWEVLGKVTPDGLGQVRFEDDRVSPGRRYGYRLGVPRESGEDVSTETWVVTPQAPVLALEGFRPHPASVHLTVSLSVPAHEPATIEFLDVSGRRVMRRDLGTLRAGHHVIDLGPSRVLKPGVYYLRLTQHGISVAKRAVLSE